MHIWALNSDPWPWSRLFTNLMYTGGGAHGPSCILVLTFANPILTAHLKQSSTQMFWKFCAVESQTMPLEVLTAFKR